MTIASDKAASDKAAADKMAADKEKANAPKTANEVLAKVDEDHDWKELPEDLNTTGGIQMATKRNRAAIQALANYIDGKR